MAPLGRRCLGLSVGADAHGGYGCHRRESRKRGGIVASCDDEVEGPRREGPGDDVADGELAVRVRVSGTRPCNCIGRAHPQI